MLIGEGQYGSVHLFNNTQAVKKISLQNKEVFQKEAFMALKTINFQHSIPVKKCFTENNFGYIVMELAKSNLLDVVKINCFKEKEISKIFYNLCLGVLELHSNNIAHLDLKLENILICGENNNLKLCDFGCAVEVKEKKLFKQPKIKIGSPIYCAPEIAFENEYQPFKADIWSLGII